MSQVLETPGLQAHLEARTRAYGARLLWPEVGARYRSLLHEARSQARPAARSVTHIPVAALASPPAQSVA